MDDDHPGQVWFSGDYQSWEEARRQTTGYDDPRILERVLGATLKVQSGEAAYERDSVTFDRVEYSVPLLACLLYVASRARGRLHVMDIGGSLGSSYRQNRRFLTHLEDFRWSVVEQPHFVAVGAAHVADQGLSFFTSIAECVSASPPNVALLSSVLPYVAAPYDLLGSVLQQPVDFVVIDRTPYFVEDLPDRITIERVPAEIYEASYPAWFFNGGKFRHFVRDSPFEIFEEFDSWESWSVGDDRAQSKCHLLVRRARAGDES